MANLVGDVEIAEFPGAPFPADVLTAAGETVRTVCDWHIAPSQTDTVTLDSDGGCYLYVQSLHVTALVQVRDMTGTTPVVLSDVTFKPNGRLFRRIGFPCGTEAVEVSFTHGYAACPTDLLPIVAAAARTSGDSRLPRQQSLGSASISYESASQATNAQKVLDSYTIPGF